MAKKRGVKIFFAGLAVLLLVAIISTIVFLPSFLKNKITEAVNNNSDFVLKIDGLELGFSSATLSAVELEPKKTKEDFFKEKGYEDDWIKSYVSNVRISGINWRLLLSGKSFSAERIEINKADIYVYRDKRLPDKYRHKPLVASLLQNMKTKFSIPDLSMSDSKVTYEEITEQTGKPIVVSFNELNAIIRNLSSDTAYMNLHPDLTINARSSVLDSIKVEVSYSGNTLSKNNSFEMAGVIKSFSATHLNRCIEPATKTAIESGYVSHIDFQFTANDDQSNGKLNIDYSNLKLNVEEEVKQDKLKTFIANLFVKNKDSQPLNEEYTGEIEFSRRKDRFIFNYWWNSFKSGIISSVLREPAKKAIQEKARPGS